jgi:hypothetical protein
LQLVIIGILGAFAKWIFDEYNRMRDRAATLNGFRKEALGRLIRVTNKVRRAPILIEAAPSTYLEQMRWLIDSRLELSFVRHEIQTASEKPGEKAFAKYEQIRGYISEMENYLDSLIVEFKDKNRQIVSTGSIFKKSEEDMWHGIKDLPKLNDLMRGNEKSSQYYMKYVLSYSGALDLMRKEIWSADRCEEQDKTTEGRLTRPSATQTEQG